MTSTPPWPTKQYSLILADPPWLYRNKLSDDKAWGAATSAYPCMPTRDIAALPVPAIAESNCMLAMWATGPKLPEAIEVMDAWGFEYVQILFVWVKTGKHTENYLLDTDTDFPTLRGYYTNTNVELVLGGRRGYAPAIYDDTVRQLIFAPRDKHSRKPVQVQDRLVRLFGDISRIELFARATFPLSNKQGWDTWGNEA